MLRLVAKLDGKRDEKIGKLAARRLGLGLSQLELAGQLGVHPMTLSKWERDVLPVPAYIDLAVEALEARQNLASKKKTK